MRVIRRGFNILKESLISLKRNFAMGLASTISIAAMLVLFGVVFLLLLNINAAVSHLGNELDKVVIYLKDEASSDSVNKLIEEIGEDSNVKDISYTSSEQALIDFKEQLGDKGHVIDTLNKNPLPASLVVTLSELSYASEFSENIAKNENVDRVDYHYELVEKMMKFQSAVTVVGYAIVAILLFVSVLVIHNTIKIAVGNRSNEINIMKYVGASNSYIRGPFLIEGIIFGIVGALVAYFGIDFIYRIVFEEYNSQIFSMLGMNLVSIESIRANIPTIFTCIGVGVGFLGSWISTKRFLDV